MTNTVKEKQRKLPKKERIHNIFCTLHLVYFNSLILVNVILFFLEVHYIFLYVNRFLILLHSQTFTGHEVSLKVSMKNLCVNSN